MFNFKKYFQIINEGGAGGHMAHPFDVPTVKNGTDLIELFNKTAEYLEQAPAILKVDGTNISVKLVTTSGIPQFGVDRGSSSALDREGVTIDKLGERFPENPNLAEKCKIVLKIFNESIPSIQKEIKQLNLTDPNRYINMEFVEGKSNVIAYGGNFLVLHNIGEFYIGETKKTKKPTRLKKPVTYNEQALYSLSEKISVAAQKYDFTAYHKIEGRLAKTPDLGSRLAKPFALNIGGTLDTQIKPLRQWLKEVSVNPVGQSVQFLDGTKKDALNKQSLYVPATEDVPLVSFIENSPGNIKKAIDGIIMYHATRVLGNEIIRNIEFPEPFGPGEKQEGIVINNSQISPVMFKITGEFIISGLDSPFKKQIKPAQKTVVFTYGRFNPPTQGHTALIEKLAKIGKENNAELIAVVPTHTQDRNKNPLPLNLKVQALEDIVNSVNSKYGTNIKILPQGKTFIQLLKYFTENQYSKAIQLAGSDRVNEFLDLVKRYNNTPGKQGEIAFNIPDYNVVSAGERDPDSEGIAGVSGTKVRQAAKETSFNEFKKSGIASDISEDTLKLIYNILNT